MRRRVAPSAGGWSDSWVVLGGCASNKTPAPVETRGPASGSGRHAGALRPRRSAGPPGAENAGQPALHRQTGDNLIRIAPDNGQNWRDLVMEQAR